MLNTTSQLPSVGPVAYFRFIHLMHLGQFMFSFKNAILPRKFENIFTINNQIHRYNTTEGMQIPFVYHYVEQISDNSPYSFKVLNFLILFHLKFRALRRWHLFKKNLKHILFSDNY